MKKKGNRLKYLEIGREKKKYLEIRIESVHTNSGILDLAIKDYSFFIFHFSLIRFAWWHKNRGSIP